LVAFAALNKDFSQKCAKRKRDGLDESQRQVKAKYLKNFKDVVFLSIALNLTPA
jgi:hypothetical protein